MRVIKCILLVSFLSSFCLARDPGAPRGRKPAKSQPKTVTIKVPNEPTKNAQTQMLNGILSGSLNDVKQAISAGADVNKLDADGKAPILLAVTHGEFSIANALLESGVTSDSLKDNTVAQAVVDTLKVDIGTCLGLLVSKGVDFSFADPKTAQAISILTIQAQTVAQTQPVVQPIAQAPIAMPTSMPPLPAIPTPTPTLAPTQPVITKEEAQMQLNTAILKGSLPDVKKAIVAGADINLIDSEGKTSIWQALLIDYPSIIYELLKSGAKADVIYKDQTFTQALVANALKAPAYTIKVSDYIKCLSLLVGSGVDFSAASPDIITVTLNRIHINVGVFSPLSSKDPVSMQIKADILELIQQLLLHGYPIVDKLWNYNASYESVYKSKDLIDFCLKNGISINQNLPMDSSLSKRLNLRSTPGNAPALFSAIWGSYDKETTAMENLLDAGADMNLPADPDGKGLQTPLGYAISLGKADAIRILMQRGAKQSI